MTFKKFYKTKFTPAFNAYIHGMYTNGKMAVAHSYDICALKELNARMGNEAAVNGDYDPPAYTACSGEDFIKEFLAWFDTAEFGSDIFSCSDARSEAFDSFFTQFEEEWNRR